MFFSFFFVMRILGIDYGCKRTGIATTDPLQIIATGLETVATTDVESWLDRYMRVENVERIVVGRPLHLNGSESEMMVNHIEPFISRLKKKYPSVIIETFDERYTSKMASNVMIEGGMKKKDRREKTKIDKISANILLQNFLEKITFERKKI